ncbi:MAG: S-layer homology domain-containing protein [Synergistaceae bacterium]|nr:S-layer homology domain-containing protein [Synergistaceae bacterium]
MKKLIIAVAVLVAFTTPVFAATNPFMDVPINHWAYDAIGQLAASGVLSGYPDGTYKGKQPTTRYEMASALARALALVDMTKASKQDVEMLKRLVVEFKDELDALGVQVDQIDGRLGKIEDRLGGWRFTGALIQDFQHVSNYGAGDDDRGFGDLRRARLFVDRWFGDEDKPMHFFTRIEGSNGAYSTGYTGKADLSFTRFYVEIPAFYDTVITVGRTFYDFDVPYYQSGGFVGLMYLRDNMTGAVLDQIGVSKAFGLGNVTAYVARPVENPYVGGEGITGTPSLWEAALNASLQFSEQLGADLGIQYWFGDDASILKEDEDTYKLKSLMTYYGGLRFDFTPSVTLKGVYYGQSHKVEDDATGVSVLDDSFSAYKIIVQAKQDLLKFTSLWAEYGHYEEGFWARDSINGGIMDDPDFSGKSSGKGFLGAGNTLDHDLKMWRVAAEQVWNDKWSTYLFYTHYDVDTRDDFAHYGIGASYRLNPNVAFGLLFTTYKYGDAFDAENEQVIRFRTNVTF